MWSRFFKGLVLLVSLKLAALSPQRIREIEKRLEQIGGLKFRNPPGVVYLSRGEMEKMIKEEMKSREAGIFRALGIVGKDYAEVKRKLYIMGAVGVFSPAHPGKVFISRDWGEYFQEFALVHELRHYLQWENFPETFKILEKGFLGEDSTTAALAILEGDANFVTLKYFGQRSLPANFQFLGLPQGKSGKFLGDIFTFVYRKGYLRIREEWERAGWAGVFHLLGRPPSHTAAFFGKSYKKLSCPCTFPLSLGFVTYRALLGEVAEYLEGDCLCLQGKKLYAQLLFSSPRAADLAASKFSYKIKVQKQERKLILQGEVQYDPGNPGKEGNDP